MPAQPAGLLESVRALGLVFALFTLAAWLRSRLPLLAFSRARERDGLRSVFD